MIALAASVMTTTASADSQGSLVARPHPRLFHVKRSRHRIRANRSRLVSAARRRGARTDEVHPDGPLRMIAANPTASGLRRIEPNGPRKSPTGLILFPMLATTLKQPASERATSSGRRWNLSSLSSLPTEAGALTHGRSQRVGQSGHGEVGKRPGEGFLPSP